MEGCKRRVKSGRKGREDKRVRKRGVGEPRVNYAGDNYCASEILNAANKKAQKKKKKKKEEEKEEEDEEKEEEEEGGDEESVQARNSQIILMEWGCLCQKGELIYIFHRNITDYR
ncbi:hypothetical protein M8J77_024996 [Diaphorina citri]|nr:hypothetical protein M8J77_024996 [Diaphorina citri]